MLGVGVGGGRRRGSHEGEDCVQGEGADEGEAVDVAEVDFAAEEEEGAEEEEEEDWACKVRVVHYVLVDAGEGVEDCEGLFVFVEGGFWLAGERNLMFCCMLCFCFCFLGLCRGRMYIYLPSP